MARHLFIYWRLQQGRLAETQRAVHTMQAELRRRNPGLTARLFVRSGGGEPTLMETYARLPEGIDDALEAEIEALALQLASSAAGPRHVEVFDELHGA